MATYRKLSRTSSQRKALLRGQVTALLNNGKIVTTEEKAKEAFFAMEDILFEEMFSCAKVKLYGIVTITKVIMDILIGFAIYK